MPVYADLELALRRRDGSTYTADLRYTSTTNEVDRRADEVVVFDLAALRKLEPDWKAYGSALSLALFTGAAGKAFSDYRQDVQANGFLLRIRLHIETSAAELQSLHWETMRDPDFDGPLFAGEQIAFSRYLNSVDWRPVKTRPRGSLRALVAIANPSNLSDYGQGDQPLAAIDVSGELGRAETALRPMGIGKLATPGAATLDNIMGRLADGFDILYLVCHGALIERQPRRWEPCLYLESAAGGVATVSGTELVKLMQDLPKRPRLVVLASCESAGEGAGEELEAVASALGPQLARAGIPAVLAMRGKISMETVDLFMPVFFRELMRDGQIDRAMSVARRTVQKRPDYWIPVLYMRLRSGCIWYVSGFGAAEGFDQWKSIVKFVAKGDFVPILGPDLAEGIFGTSRELAAELAASYRFPLSNDEGLDPAKVLQFINTDASLKAARQAIRDALLSRMRKKARDLFGSVDNKAALPALMGGIAKKLAADEDDPLRILAGLKAKVYVTAGADPMLELVLIEAGKKPVEFVCKWRDETVQKEVVGDPDADHPLLYYAYGKIKYEETWVLTEDDFFDYLIQISKYENLMPGAVKESLTTGCLMFLGFSLDDWKFRILFRMILARGGSAKLKEFNHVGVQLNPDEASLADAGRARKVLEKYFGETKIHIYWGTAADFLKDLKTQMKQYTAEEEEESATVSSDWP